MIGLEEQWNYIPVYLIHSLDKTISVQLKEANDVAMIHEYWSYVMA